jgi:insertion element IS1 protein InsB
MLQHLHPEQVEVEIWRGDALEVRRGLSSELDEMWSYVRSKANPCWLWHAIDHHTGTVLAYVLGRRQDTVFLKLKGLLEPFGITRYFTDGWGAYERHVEAEQHTVGKAHTQKIETDFGCVPPFTHSALKRAVLLMMPAVRRRLHMDLHGRNMHLSTTKSVG